MAKVPINLENNARATSYEEEERERDEGCVDPIREEAEFLVWMYHGELGQFNPIDQSEFDDDFAKAKVSSPWPLTRILAKWRPVSFDLWRRLMENL